MSVSERLKLLTGYCEAVYELMSSDDASLIVELSDELGSDPLGVAEIVRSSRQAPPETKPARVTDYPVADPIEQMQPRKRRGGGGGGKAARWQYKNVTPQLQAVTHAIARIMLEQGEGGVLLFTIRRQLGNGVGEHLIPKNIDYYIEYMLRNSYLVRSREGTRWSYTLTSLGVRYAHETMPQ